MTLKSKTPQAARQHAHSAQQLLVTNVDISAAHSALPAAILDTHWPPWEAEGQFVDTSLYFAQRGSTLTAKHKAKFGFNVISCFSDPWNKGGNLSCSLLFLPLSGPMTRNNLLYLPRSLFSPIKWCQSYLLDHMVMKISYLKHVKLFQSAWQSTNISSPVSLSSVYPCLMEFRGLLSRHFYLPSWPDKLLLDYSAWLTSLWETFLHSKLEFDTHSCVLLVIS